MLIDSIRINLESVEVQAALIGALGSVVTAIIASIAAAIVGRLFLSSRRLRELLQIATEDIEFLLAVEQLHCEQHREREERSYKRSMRDKAREMGLDWSGKFTPGRIAALRFADRMAQATKPPSVG